MILGTILLTGFTVNDASAAAFAKYTGIDGESEYRIDEHEMTVSG